MLSKLRTKKFFVVVAACMILAGFGGMQASAISLGDVIKVGGIGILVDRFGPELNKFINGLMGKNNLDPYDATKVVPIISLGDGGYIGAAQVQGPKAAVDKVQAVAQVEANFSGRTFRIKMLVPVDNINPTNISRVKGVGVSAVIDVRI